MGFEFEPREAKARKAAAKAGQPGNRSRRLISPASSRWANVPMCGKRVFEGGAAYVCEHRRRTSGRASSRSTRSILQQPIDREQAARLLAEGKTDLLQEFISAKTGRPFPAYLVMDEEGKVTFDFPPREAETDQEPGEVMPGQTLEPPVNDKWIEKFLQHLATDRGASAYTQRNYRQAMWEFHRWHQAERQQPPDWETLQRDDFRAYLRFLGRHNLSRAAIQLRFCALRTFYRFLVRHGVVAASPIRNLALPKLGKRLPNS